MGRYKPGSLEEAIKNLIADAIMGTEEESEQEDSDQQERGGVHNRGRVRDPERDRRLKENRGDAA